MGNGCKCASTKSRRSSEKQFPVISDPLKDMEEHLFSNQVFLKENSIGPYFLLDLENENMSLTKKTKYLQKVMFLLRVASYDSLYKKKYGDPPKKINLEEMNSQNHKEFFVNTIHCQDLTIIYSNESKANLVKYFENNPKELKKIIFNGPPQIFRSLLWNLLLTKNKIFLKSSEFIDIMKNNIPSEELKREILSDLSRTYPDLKLYKEDQFKHKLKNLLENFACYDKELNYVQGMNFIVGYLLLFEGGEEYLCFNFFLLLQKLRSELIKEKYRDSLTPGFKFLFEYIDLFRNVFGQHNSDLKNKFFEQGFNEFFWFSKWVQTLFTYNFNFYTITRFWDFIIAKGFDFIIIISLSVLDFLEKDFAENKLELDGFLKLFDKAYKYDKDRSCELIRLIKSNSRKKEYTRFLSY